jgi:hypothetical protein
VAALSLARIPVGLGVAASLPRPQRRILAQTVVLLGLSLAFAVAATVLAWRRPEVGGFGVQPRDADALASAAALLALAACAWELQAAIRFVVGAGDRGVTALGVLVASALAAGVLLVLGYGGSDRVLRSSLAVASVGVTYACTQGDAEVVARRGRRLATLLVCGGPLVLLGGLAAQGAGHAVSAVLGTGLGALLLGAAVRHIEGPLRREEGHLLDAVDAAHRVLLGAHPEASVREALAALRVVAGAAPVSPELWSLGPSRVLTVDGAGYLHERPCELPTTLIDVASQEPEATVRAELIEALVVRRPDLRPLARWLDERGALSATLATRGGDVEGVLIVPRGARRAPLSLEEVRAVKRLADAFSGASATEAAFARSLEREQRLMQRVGEADGRVSSARQRATWADARARLAMAQAVDEAVGGPYSPAAKMAFDAIARCLRIRQVVVLVAAAGSDAARFAVRAGGVEASSGGPVVLLDGAESPDQGLTRWTDRERSPLALASGGLLVVEAADRLSAEVWGLLGEALATRRAPWPPAEILDVRIALLVRGPIRLDPGLRDTEHDGPLPQAIADSVAWPRLRDRGEDLRALVLAGLAREGVRVRGRPLGIEDAAYARLANHPYPGEECELRSLLLRLAVAAEDDVVRVRDVDVVWSRAAAPGAP